MLAAMVLAAASSWDTLAMQREFRELQAARLTLVPRERPPEDLRAALRREPLRADLLRDLGMGMTEEEDGLKLLQLAARVTRREPLTQIVLLESAAQAGELGETLSHYDVLLATSPTTRSLLHPRLVAGLASPEIVEALEQYGDRAWFVPFLSAAATLAPDPRPVAILAGQTRQFADNEIAQSLTPRLLSALTSKGHLVEAFQLAAAATNGQQAWRRFDLSEPTTATWLEPLTWSLSTKTQANAELVDAGAVLVTVEPLTAARVMRRITNLAPGSYNLRHAADQAAVGGVDLEWRIACLPGSGGAPFWRQKLDPTDQAESSGYNIAIPAGCPFQEWGLWARGPDTQTARTAYLAELRLRPL